MINKQGQPLRVRSVRMKDGGAGISVIRPAGGDPDVVSLATELMTIIRTEPVTSVAFVAVQKDGTVLTGFTDRNRRGLSAGAMDIRHRIRELTESRGREE